MGAASVYMHTPVSTFVVPLPSLKVNAHRGVALAVALVSAAPAMKPQIVVDSPGKRLARP